MQKTLLQEAKKYTKRNQRRRIWRKFVQTMACIVVFCTTYALILPAITMEKTPCDQEEHIHGESCYEKVGSEGTAILGCSYESLGVHVHTSGCYDGENQLICGQADYLIHKHNDACVDGNGTIVCHLPEVSAHEHSDACYRVAETDPAETQTMAAEVAHVHDSDCYGTERGKLICQATETEGHSHGKTCFTKGPLICQLTEGEGHTHDTGCYESVLTCELSEEPAYQHTDGCYEMVTVLVCGQEEGVSSAAAEETMDAAKLELICTEPAAQVHIHSEDCFVAATVGEDLLTCTLPEDENHTHGAMCYGTWALICGKEEHTHDLVCRNDPEADVETQVQWMATFADVTLTGEWGEDLISIARSQLGYQESTRNYEVMEDGETIKGYTRYGDWYGMPYGDWCAMFVSFCLNYAEIPQDAIPYEANCPEWIEVLQNPDNDLYRSAGEYTPVPGDLIFFDWDEDSISDHVGIVAEIVPATEEEPAKIKTIEGNIEDCVAEQEYDMDDVVILGFAKLPEKPPAYDCGLLEHTHDASCMDENGALLCGIDEHTHTDKCLSETAYYCGLEEHTHGETCWDENGELICGLEEHTHSVECTLPLELSEEDRTAVADVIRLIDALPAYDEIMAKLDEFYEADDTEGEEAYLAVVYGLVEEAYRGYMALGDDLQAYVTNADKLMELEFIWSRITLEETYNYSDLAHAAENTRIYLFDYGHMINERIGGQGFLPFYRLFPEYSYTVDGEEAWDHDTVGGPRYSQVDSSAPVLNKTLVNGYPYISEGKQDDNGSWHTEWGSLRYLFDPTFIEGNYWGADWWPTHVRENTSFTNPYTADAVNPSGLAPHFRRAYLPVKNNGSGTGLFLKDEDGYWYYDSGKNAAWYNPETQQFELYNYTVIPGHEAFHNYGETTNGNFIPFNKGHVEGRTDYQTNEDLIHNSSGNLEENTGEVWWNNRVTANVGEVVDGHKLLKENFRLITSDRTNSVNLNFGMVVEFDFFMPKDGMLDGDGDGVMEPMKFVFKGDDDVWVFIDDVLVLDIGGCHDAQSATIDFSTGALTQPGAAAGYSGYKEELTTLKQAFEKAGKSTSGFNGETFANFSGHTLKFFYMERGGNVSFCRLKFNMPQLPENAISVKKELSSDVQTLGNPDYTFSLMALDNDNKTRRLFLGNANVNAGYSILAKTKYRILDSNNNYVTNPNPIPADNDDKLFTTDKYGIFKLKAGQTAVFEKITASKPLPNFYVQELIQEADYEQYMTYVGKVDGKDKYSSDIKVNGKATQWQGKIDWKDRVYFNARTSEHYNSQNTYIGPYGHVWYGASGPTTDPNTGDSIGFQFNQQNGVYENRLAELFITKQLDAYSNATKDVKYKINVELDGEPLPKGTTYEVGNETRTVGIDESGNSYVELVGGETALIANILSGTKFRVWESEKSAKGHTVTYSNNSVEGNGENVVADSTGVTGIIRVKDQVMLTVSNKQHGTSLTIPVTKSFRSFAGGPYEYTFTLTEMIPGEDGSYTQVGDKPLQSKNVEFRSGGVTEFDFEAITYLKHEFDSLPANKYYLIEETGETSPTMDNTMQYLVKVTIEENAKTGEITPKITNILQRSSAEGEWEDKGASNVEFVNTLTGKLTVIKKVEGSSLEMPMEGFKFKLTLESAGFLAEKKDQYGNVTEETVTAASYEFTLKHSESITFTGIPIGTKWTLTETAPGFIQEWLVDGVTEAGASASGNITIAGTTASCINTVGYELPETGGAGTIPYTMAGLVLICFSMAFLMYRTKARRREEF